MIYIATVHWHDPRFIEIQNEFFTQYAGGDFRVFGFLNEIDAYYDNFYYYSNHESISGHAVKLNILGDMIALIANDDDIVIFVDGDAFPVAPLAKYYDLLDQHSLIAIQRLENFGDIQPHPCFAMMKVRTWKQYDWDWKRGYKWENSQGRLISDVGGNMLKVVVEQSINWLPLVRTNKNELHPLWFGVYDNTVYHHGAAFRNKICRLDIQELRTKHPLYHALETMVDKVVPKPYRAVIKSCLPYRRQLERTSGENSLRIYNKIRNGEDFLSELDSW